jgi:hypothetical protein
MAIIESKHLGVEAYHNGPEVSHSKLLDYARRGPRYYAARYVTRKAPRPAPSDAFLFGQAFEDLVYGLPIGERYAVKPEGMIFAKVDGKAWKTAAEASGKLTITHDDAQAMDAMRESIRENDTAMRMIKACVAQTSFIAPYGGTPGIQARPDWWSSTGLAESGFRPFTLDLKSTIGLAKLASGRGVADYGYHSQAAMAAECAVRNGVESPACFLLAVEKVAPYRCQVVEITPEWLAVGWTWCERQLEKLRAHYATGDWPRVTSEIVALPPVPAWAASASEIEDQEDAA